MKFVVGENGRYPEKNLPRPRFVHHETHMEGPRCELGTPAVEGERLTACAMRPPIKFQNVQCTLVEIQYYKFLYISFRTCIYNNFFKNYTDFFYFKT